MDQVDYKKLIEEGRSFLSLEWDYTKLTATEKLSVLLSGIATVVVIGILCTFGLFYLLSSLAEAITLWTGSPWIANLLIVVLLAVLVLVVVATKRKLIVNPITRYITRLFLTPNNNEPR